MVLIFLISICIHEFSHIIIGICFGYKLKKFKIVPFGTAIKFDENLEINYIKKIMIYLAGPISNFVICFFSYILNTKYCFEIFYTNAILGIFNLLPLNPLDGGKILRELLIKIFKNKKANIYFYNINKFLLCVITFLYSIFIIKIKNISLLIILIYLWYLDVKESKKIMILKKVYSIIEKSVVKN